MRCLHPFTRRYYDSLHRVVRVQECPCGKCIACLHNQQDSWSIRALETCKAFRGGFVFDTLTFAPQNLPLCDVTPLFTKYRGERVVSLESCLQMSFYNKGKAGYFVPYVTRSIIRDWIRRGRELFVYRHGYRPKWKYLIFMEHGPQTSRPHFHLLFFGISHADYLEYLARPWRRTVGFTRTKWIKQDSKKDREAVCRYVSKYCSKGVFESPFVKDGLVPKPFHCISHGIGEEYLLNKVFDWFNGIMPKFYLSISLPSYRKVSLDTELDCYRSRLRLQDYLSDGCLDLFEGWYKDPPEEVIRALTCYVDSNGCLHPLPRYYKQKLLQVHKPNLLCYALQTLLLARAERDRYKSLAEFARSMGFRVSKKAESSPSLGLSFRSFNLVCRGFVSHLREQARLAAARRKIKLDNLYKRPMLNKAYAWAC